MFILLTMLYKVVATHPYTWDDVKYDESDGLDDGCLLGVMESTGVQGISWKFHKNVKWW